jgi:hypothetical protein
MKTKAEATREGKRLLGLLKGKGWKLRVHENLGWHFAAVNERHAMQVYPSVEDSWGCLPYPSYSHLCDLRNSSDPNNAVKATIRSVRKSVDEHAAILAKVSSIYETL